MANCSDAYGVIHIVAPKELAKKAAWVIDHTLGINNACYFTDVEAWEEVGDGVIGNFNGCGRWSYEANCEYFHDWIEHSVENKPKDMEDEEYKTLCAYWEELKKSDWSITWDFKDEECGMEVLYEATISVAYKNGSHIYHEHQLTNYDYTAENLVELGYYDSIEEAQESLS